MPYYVDVKGLNKAVRDLSRLGVASDDLRGAFNSIALRVAVEARRRVHSPSGRNRAAIRPSRRKNAAVVRFNRKDRGRQVASYIFFNSMESNPGGYGFIWAAVDAVGEDWIRDQVDGGLNAAIAKAGLG